MFPKPGIQGESRGLGERTTQDGSIPPPTTVKVTQRNLNIEVYVGSAPSAGTVARGSLPPPHEWGAGQTPSSPGNHSVKGGAEPHPLQSARRTCLRCSPVPGEGRSVCCVVAQCDCLESDDIFVGASTPFPPKQAYHGVSPHF